MKSPMKTKALAGGRLYVSHDPDYSVLLALIALASLTSVLSRAFSGVPNLFLSLVIANLAAVLIIAVILVGFLKVRRRHSPGSSYSFAAIILAGLMLGLVKWVLTSMFMAQLGVPEIAYNQPIGRAIFSGLGGAILLSGLVLFSAIRFKYSKQRTFLVQALQEQEGVEGDYPSLLLSLLSNLRDRFQEGKKPITSHTLAMEIRGFVSEVLRPLSKDIWRTEFKSLPDFRLAELLKSALTKHVYFWPLVVPIYALSNIFPAIVERELAFGLIYVGFRAVILLVVLVVAGKVTTKTDTQAIFLYTAAIALIGALNFGASQLVSPSPPLEDFQNWILGQIWLVVVTITVGVFRALAAGGEAMDKFYGSWIRDRVESSSVSLQLSKYEDRQLAQYLHGTVQSKLSNLATHLEQDPDKAALDGSLKLVDQVISDALREYHERRVKTLEEMTTRLEADWGGLVELTFLFSDVPLPEGLVDKISQVINEAVANAYRHGNATRVSIDLSEDLQLTVMDDGDGPTNTIPGLGSALFDSIASEWSIIAGDAGSTLLMKMRT